MAGKRILVVGASGQVGRALRDVYAHDASVEYATRADLDLSDPDLAGARAWRDYSVIVNAAAYTAVDDAETPAGRVEAWAANATGVSRLASVAATHGITLVHISSDYVFDGTADGFYDEDASFSPLGVYGQSKAAGDLAAATAPRHYILRASWVVGTGRNFVTTMADLARRGVSPRVVADQRGRLTFATDIARAIQHLVDVRAPYGAYNISSSGDVMAWSEIAREVFRSLGADPSLVVDTSTAEYFAGAERVVAPRPSNSALSLTKIEATGFVPTDGLSGLRDYVGS